MKQVVIQPRDLQKDYLVIVTFVKNCNGHDGLWPRSQMGPAKSEHPLGAQRKREKEGGLASK